MIKYSHSLEYVLTLKMQMNTSFKMIWDKLDIVITKIKLVSSYNLQVSYFSFSEGQVTFPKEHAALGFCLWHVLLVAVNNLILGEALGQ